ncbi:uncharacterized protein ACNLHF_018378 [Anomaloglossus baeobatrachus]|uniref:uncharacterized protein LOC142313299 n=1 Tax=Anomaloglossus baeobatrachus TaxID=238106 RepID=UPI003F50ABBE
MKYLIVLALLVHALAGPARKPEKHPGGPLGPKPTGSPHLFDHNNVTGLPPHDNSSRPHHPEDTENSAEDSFDHNNATGHNNSSKPPHPKDLDDDHHRRHRRQAGDEFHSEAPKTGNPPPANGPKPAGGPPPSGKPPAEPAAQANPGQNPKPRPKRHLRGAENHPTGAPHGDHTHSAHTHESGASRPTHPANHGGDHHGGNKGQKG